MNSQRTLSLLRWTLAGAVLAGIVLVYRRWLHVNPTTVALTLLLYVLVLSALWGLRYAVVMSLFATAAYNFYFLPPTETFTINDPQNWLALFALLFTSIVASKLSQRAREEAAEARSRQRELEMLFRLSSELMQTDSVASLLASIPSAVASATNSPAAALFLTEGERLYQIGEWAIGSLEMPHLAKTAETITTCQTDADQLQIPVRSGVRVKGLLLLRGVELSMATADAIGSLVAVSIDRAQALETVARGEAAKESERLRTLMMDSVTHELRTPLTSIKGAASALLQTQPQDGPTHELLTIIDEESDRLNQLVSEAVEMSQLDARQVQLQLEPVNVAALIERARQNCAWIEELHTLELRVPQELQLRADPRLLVKVLCNLLENAAKYSSAGTKITVSAENTRDHVEISVADRGAGIDPAEQGLVFERFYRGRAGHEGSAGTGMGLAISRAIVEAHHGRIRLVSREGEGSVFTVELPKS